MGGLLAYVVPTPLEADRASGTAAALNATRLLGSGWGSRARSGNLLRSFQNASISPSSLRFYRGELVNAPFVYQRGCSWLSSLSAPRTATLVASGDNPQSWTWSMEHMTLMTHYDSCCFVERTVLSTDIDKKNENQVQDMTV